MLNYVTCFITGGLIGLISGIIFTKKMSLKNVLKYFLANLDNVFIVLAAICIFATIIADAFAENTTIPIIFLNIFSSLIFSWLLTKKSAKIDFERHEQELAKKSYRHLNYIEVASKSAYKMLEQYTSNTELIESQKLVISRAMDNVMYIQGGIETCKFDWEDLMSNEDVEKLKNDSNIIKIDISKIVGQSLAAGLKIPNYDEKSEKKKKEKDFTINQEEA